MGSRETKKEREREIERVCAVCTSIISVYPLICRNETYVRLINVTLHQRQDIWVNKWDALDFITNKINFEDLTQNRVKGYNKQNCIFLLKFGVQLLFSRIIFPVNLHLKHFCYDNLVLILSTLGYIKIIL